VDEQIVQRFDVLGKQAHLGLLDSWQTSARPALAQRGVRGEVAENVATLT
jgi:hypothetical protein